MVSLWLLVLLAACSIATASSSWTLSSKNIIVTGGTKGIGKAIVEECSELGGCVLTCGRNEEELQSCQAAWQEKGYKTCSIVADMSTEEGRQKLIAMALQLFGEDGIHCLVNNVGTNIRKKSQDYSVEEYRKIMDTNLDSAFLLSNSFYPYLKKNKNSAIVNIGSVAGGCQTSLRSGVVYAMTKAAMNQMTYNQACEWAADGIRVNAVCPWYIDTPLARPVLENPESLKEVLGRTPMNRVGNVEEVSSITAFLLMDKASYITGQNVAVDGGFTRNGFY